MILLLVLEFLRKSSIFEQNIVTNFLLGEMQLCFDLIQDWLMKNPKASICTPEGLNEFREIAIFQDYHGLPKFRNVRRYMLIKKNPLSSYLSIYA